MKKCKTDKRVLRRSGRFPWHVEKYQTEQPAIHTKVYYTRIKNNDDVVGGGNKYVRGVIMGIMMSVCEYCTGDEFLTWLARGTNLILVDKRSGDNIYCICTTQERYDMFTSIVEKQYPGICDFDIYD